MQLPSGWRIGGFLAVAGLLAVPLTVPTSAGPQEPDSGAVLIRAKRVIVRPGKSLADTEVLCQDGRIVAVGQGLTKPDGAVVIEGDVVCAGFIDPWSTLGLESATASDAGTSAATRALDGYDLYSGAHLRADALRAGVTAMRVQAGDGSPIGGIGAVVRLTSDAGPADVVVLDDSNVAAAVGKGRPGRPVDVFDRIGAVDKLVGEIEKGRKYREDWVEYHHELEEWQTAIAEKEAELEKDFKKAKKARDKDVAEAEEDGKEHKEKKYKEDKKPKAPKYDADKEVLARVAEGELPLIVQVHRSAEIRALIAGTEPFDRLRLAIAGGTEALSAAGSLAEREIPVIVWPAPLGTAKSDELDGHDLSLAGRLSDKGVEVLIGSGGGASSTRDLSLLAGLAIGHGLDREEAFAALTVGAARALDVADRLGTVQRGKDADLLVLDGDPLLSTTRVRYVVSGGRIAVTPGN